MGWGGLGWGKILSHSIGGDIALGNWRAHYNKLEDSIDILHPSDGIPYVKTDTTFLGTITGELVVTDGVLSIESFPGWDEAIFKDETFVVGDEDTLKFDETDSGSALIDALFDSTSTPMYYEAGGSFISNEIDLAYVGKYHSSKLEWVLDTNPETSETKVYSSAQYNGGEWGEWVEVEASANPIGALPSADKDLSLYKIKHKVTMKPTTDLSDTPEMSELKTTINSQKHFRVMSDGSYKESPHIVASVLGATTETLT